MHAPILRWKAMKLSEMTLESRHAKPHELTEPRQKEQVRVCADICSTEAAPQVGGSTALA